MKGLGEGNPNPDVQNSYIKVIKNLVLFNSFVYTHSKWGKKAGVEGILVNLPCCYAFAL